MKKKYPWETNKISYKEWANMSFDWSNYNKINSTINSYFFRRDNYLKGLNNSHIMKSTFGRKNKQEIEKEIEWWFSRCIGAYSEIEYE